jgi:hypothetical protein
MRREGWSVAVHNDYQQNGQFYTFWLFTRGNQCVKGEGSSDLEAIKCARLAADELDATERARARPIPRGKDREATRAAFRAQAEKAGPSPVSMLAVEANPSTLPTEPGHYELAPGGGWRKVERSEK